MCESITHLAILGLIHMLHSCPLAERLQGWQGETLNLRIIHLQEVVVEGGHDLFVTAGPPGQTQLKPDFTHVFDVRAWPSSIQVVEKSIL